MSKSKSPVSGSPSGIGNKHQDASTGVSGNQQGNPSQQNR